MVLLTVLFEMSDYFAATFEYLFQPKLMQFKVTNNG